MRTSIKEAALQLGIPEQSLRCWIQSEKCPFGEILIDKKKRNGRRTYYINSIRLKKYIEGEV